MLLIAVLTAHEQACRLEPVLLGLGLSCVQWKGN